MKRTLFTILLCCICLMSATKVNAGKFGVTGGLSMMEIKKASLKTATGYHAGFTYKFKLGKGFALQPSLLYNAKATASEIGGASKLNLSVGYLELPISVQWGPDLVLFRPYLDVSPFIGYGLNKEVSVQVPEGEGTQISTSNDNWNGVNRLEYGLGLGGGIEIWRLQLVCRYNWSFGPLLNNTGKIDTSAAWDQGLNKSNFGGVTLSLSWFFK